MARRRWKMEDIRAAQAGEQPFIQFGYAPAEPPHHKVGDVWIDLHGVKWEQRNGYRLKVNTQANSIRELVKRKCRKCGIDLDVLGDHHDESFYNKTGLCADCLIFDETTLRASGKYDEYENRKLLINQLSFLIELRKNTIETIEYLEKDDAKTEWVTSQGVIVTWIGKQNAEILEGAKKDLVEIEKDIKIAKERMAILNENVADLKEN